LGIHLKKFKGIEGKNINILANVCEESELMDPGSCHLLLVYGKMTSF
jgi:hypothetical protein